MEKAIKRTVALKVLDDSSGIDFGNFFNEFKRTYDCKEYWVKTATIIRLFGASQDPASKNFIIVMEYVSNGDLHSYLVKNFSRISWTDKFNSLYYLFNGIKKIHDETIIHRDLHGGNILLMDNKEEIISRVTDLGFSLPAAELEETSEQGNIYGVIPYIAPEIFQGKPFSYASDIYSLGMIMYQLASGHRPFHDRAHDVHLAIDICNGLRPTITEDTPKCWFDLMKKCWHPDPTKRPIIGDLLNSSSENCFWEYDRDCNGKIKDKYMQMINEAEEKRIKMVESGIPFLKDLEDEHPSANYTSILLTPTISTIKSLTSLMAR
ncbi:15001_t:CDS:2 [Acaulospora colombiana]|uniref:15001_t:CDS:1 n=1 Tax=Acaulospora colombiana TaxID=27376 RepID=A0ACA9MEN8_9GLOM|nr:15001_t:CDS:2 [Acaulospora colombiana]